MKTTLTLRAALAVAGILLIARVALHAAPTDSPALVGPTTNGPTEILSNSGQFFLKSNVFVYRGNVRVDNPQMKLDCELLTVEAPKLTNGKFNRAIAETNVVIRWTDEKGTNQATADRAVYTYSLTNLAKLPEVRWQTNAFVLLTGNPVITNPQGTLRADPLLWDRVTGVITSPNFQNTTINPGQTNSAGLFEPPTSRANPAPK